MSLSPTPKVSIILPTCDRAEMTRRCLDALSAQTHPNLEVIVVDDGSRDGTPTMLKDFAAACERHANGQDEEGLFGIDEDEADIEEAADDMDMPPLEGDAEDASRMEEVD